MIADLRSYADFAPNLSRVEVLGGSGLGLRRRCYNLDGEGWNEECVLWEEGRRYTMVVDTSDYPYPFTAFRGTWSVEPAENDCIIHMRFDFEPKYSVFGKALAYLATKTIFPRVCRKLFDNWETKIRELCD